MNKNEEGSVPIPMRIPCPECGKLHIDEGTKPHHTHSCQYCGLTWRPAVVCTVGVKFLQNEPEAASVEPQSPPDELLPCPFCGSKIVGALLESTVPTDKLGVVNCGACGASGPSLFEGAELVERWNQRASVELTATKGASHVEQQKHEAATKGPALA